MSRLAAACAAGLALAVAPLVAGPATAAPKALEPAPAAAVKPAAGPAAAVTAAPAGVRIDVWPAQVESTLGETLTIHATVAGAAPTPPLIAHLDVVSLSTDVYVDPEDWSAERSVAVEPLPAGGTAQLSWPVRAVDSGTFSVYVVLVPVDHRGSAALTTSPPVHLTVAGRRALSAGGTLPVDLGIPLLLALAILATHLRRRRML